MTTATQTAPSTTTETATCGHAWTDGWGHHECTQPGDTTHQGRHTCACDATAHNPTATVGTAGQNLRVGDRGHFVLTDGRALYGRISTECVTHVTIGALGTTATARTDIAEYVADADLIF